MLDHRTTSCKVGNARPPTNWVPAGSLNRRGSHRPRIHRSRRPGWPSTQATPVVELRRW